MKHLSCLSHLNYVLKALIVDKGKLSCSEEPNLSVRNTQQDQKIPTLQAQGNAVSSLQGETIKGSTEEDYYKEWIRLLGPELLVDLHVNAGETTRGFCKDKGGGSIVF